MSTSTHPYKSRQSRALKALYIGILIFIIVTPSPISTYENLHESHRTNHLYSELITSFYDYCTVFFNIHEHTHWEHHTHRHMGQVKDWLSINFRASSTHALVWLLERNLMLCDGIKHTFLYVYMCVSFYSIR